MRKEFNLSVRVFGADNYLCHYTSFDSLCSILSTMTLRVSSFACSNDIGELESNISCILSSEKVRQVEQYIENHCSYVSFSIDKRIHAKYADPKCGYLIPSMWGIYADKSQGVCLVIDEKALIRENNSALSHAKWYKFTNIAYSKFQNLQIVSSQDTPDEITQKLYMHLLGTKHVSWSSEQERRLIGVDLPQTLSLKNGVIRGVVIGKRATDRQKEILLSVLNDPNLSCYNQLDKEIFVRQEIIGSNIYTTNFGTYLC